MFYPQEMTEIEIIVPTKDLLPITKILNGQGIFNQTDVNYLGTDKDSAQPNLWQEKASAYSGLERRVQSILNALDIRDGNPKKRDFGTLIDLDKTQITVDEIEREVKGTTEQITAESKNIDHINTILELIEPLADVDVDFSELRNSRYVHYILGMMPPENIERMKTSLSRIPFAFYTLSQKQQKAVVWLAASRDNEDVLNRAARSAYLDPIHLPEDQRGTPSEMTLSLKKSKQDSEKKIAELKLVLKDLKKQHEEHLLSLLWEVRSSRMMTNAILKYGRLKYTYIIVGWVYSSRLEWIKEKIREISKDVVIETRSIKREEDSADAPTALTNPRLIRPFQMLVTTYAQPKYSEVDPTPIVAFLFPLLFGAMFGDVGHGLILSALGGLILSKKVKKLKGFLRLAPIVLACGIVSIIFGFLYGSIFGYEEVLHPLWLQPGHNIMTILIVTIAAGVVLLSLGFLLNIYNAAKVKDWPVVFFNHNGVIGLVLYWSLIGLGASALVPNFPVPTIVFVIGAIIGGLGLMASEIFIRLMEGHRPLVEGGVVMYFVQVFFELFETLISYLSNSLSFVRVGAFAVAHANLSAVFFILAEIVDPGKGIGYWIMFLVGLVFIVGFEGLIVGIQTMRLTYYEVFGKFFRGGGKRFEPLALHPAENE